MRVGQHNQQLRLLVRALRMALLCSTVSPCLLFAGGLPVSDYEMDIQAAPNSALLGIANSASQGTVTQAQLEHRPLLRPAEVLETIPGLIVTQHSGDGKANQYFLRGFNLDHGTDFATSVDGVPVNMPTHAHGQGYSDLNFLIPELVSFVRYHKGPYSVTDGDFASAGSAQIETMRKLKQNFAQITIGENNYQRLLAAGSTPLGQGNLLAALDLSHYDGPWQEPENLRKENAIVRYSEGSNSDGWSVVAQHYQAEWDATDQIAQRAIDQGQIDRFGSLDKSSGGDTQRTSLAISQNISQPEYRQRLNAYIMDYQLNLFSNFSYFLTDPLRGDQFEQADRRTVMGGQAQHTWLGNWYGLDMENTLGADVRHDRIRQVGLYQTDQRERFATIRQDRVQQTALGIYAENQTQWQPWLRSIVGIRADDYHFDVTSDQTQNSDRVNDNIISPKASLVFGPWQKTEYYLSYGRGFHSNDARGTTIRINPDPRDSGFLQPVDRVTPLVRTQGSEFGIRSELVPNLHTTLSFWQLNSDSELLFIGDAGTTEASRPSRRQGVEWTNVYQPNNAWNIDADVAWSRSRFRDQDPSGQYIAGAIESTASAGIRYTPAGAWSSGVRLRYFGPRPLIEDNSARSSSSTLVNAQVGYQFSPRLQGTIEVLNLFNEKSNDIEYLYESCLASEATTPECNAGLASREGFTDRHIHPTEPQTWRASLRMSF